MGRRRTVIKNVEIFGIADKGRAVGRTPEGEVVFVKGAVPGDTINMLRGRRKKGVRMGSVDEIVNPSSHRTEPACDHFQDCGGCKWQNLNYDKQLKEKETVVRDAIERIAKIEDANFHPIIGMQKNPFHYRNKMEYSFTAVRWLTAEEIQSDKKFNDRRGLGMHKAGSYDKIVDIHKCWLQDRLADTMRNKIRNFTIENDFSYFHARTQEGLMRNLIIKHMRSGEMMVIPVYAYEDRGKMDLLHNFLCSEFENSMDSLYYMINGKKNDSLHDIDAIHVAGEPEIYEEIGNKKYAIGPKSFFQTNTIQAEKLYNCVVEYSELKGDEIVYDLYTGLGSIAIYIADQCRHAIGIEEIPEAIRDAEHNAALNNAENCTFYAGDVRELLNDENTETHGAADLIIADPPRAGMHNDVVESILKIAPSTIVYVSCNPGTLARDIKRLKVKYTLKDVQAVDMFPHTNHIECVTKLKRKP